MGRRVILTVVAVALAVLVVGGAAVAAVRVGTNGDDRLRGTNGDDAMSGLGGNDVLLGLQGDDAMLGGEGRDAVLGGDEIGPERGDRALNGGPGGDFVGGGRGSDGLVGAEGRDFLFAGPINESSDAVDGIAAGSGDDAVFAYNEPAARDVISCGSGVDGVLVDAKDSVSRDCERVFTSTLKFSKAVSPYYFEPLP
jgi:Ca2+-binding RTX toxin-like protein